DTRCLWEDFHSHRRSGGLETEALPRLHQRHAPQHARPCHRGRRSECPLLPALRCLRRHVQWPRPTGLWLAAQPLSMMMVTGWDFECGDVTRTRDVIGTVDVLQTMYDITVVSLG